MNPAHSDQINKIVLAYSGGLDTSVICRWLQETYNAEVVTFTADLGQGEEVEPARAKAEAMGVREIFIEDLREEFVRDFVYPMFRGNTLYEGEYLLGTSIARPLITKRLVEIAQATGADAIAHGATGKGNDQVRFEMGAYALDPDIAVIAPWRDWELTSRETLMRYCEEHQIPVDFKQGEKSPYSMDANLLHISYEGGGLEDPWQAADEAMWRWTVAPEAAPDTPLDIVIGYEHGDPVTLDGATLSPAEMLTRLNEIGGAHGIGRDDLVENRFVGMKSRGCYETPGGTILLKAHRAMESITLDREVGHLKDSVMPRYAEMIYNGYWWSPERRVLQALIDESQSVVNGEVRLRLFKGSVSVLGRRSPDSLYDADVVTFEDDGGAYDQHDAGGFIKLNALRLRVAAKRGRRLLD
ncbi:MAG: argininosuccinate synthase [Pseudomonadota bacterium]